jgi:hypothetical protein
MCESRQTDSDWHEFRYVHQRAVCLPRNVIYSAPFSSADPDSVTPDVTHVTHTLRESTTSQRAPARSPPLPPSIPSIFFHLPANPPALPRASLDMKSE